MRSILFLLILVMIGLNGKGQSVTALPDSVLSQCCLEVTLLNGNVTTVDWVFIQYITRDGTGTKLFVEYAPNFGGIQWETQIRIQDDFDNVLERSKFIILPFTVGSTDYGIHRNWIANIEENTTTGGTWIYGRFGTPAKRKFSAVEDYETMKNRLLACRPRAIVVAENGLYTEGDTVRMGGFLIENTSITTEGYNWQMKDTLSSVEFGLDYLTPETLDTTVYWARRHGSLRQMVQLGRRYYYNSIRDTLGGLYSDFTHSWNAGDPFLQYQIFNPSAPTTGTAWLKIQKDNSFLNLSNDSTNPYYSLGWAVTNSTATLGASESGSGDPGNGVVMGAYGFGTTEFLFMKTKAVDAGTATNGQFLQLINNSSGEVDFATIDLSAYLPIADTAAMLSKYIERGDTALMLTNYVTFGNLSGYPTGTGTADRLARWTATNTLAAGNLSDNGTRLAALLPWQFQSWTTAGRPTGVLGYTGLNTSFNTIDFYDGTAWTQLGLLNRTQVWTGINTFNSGTLAPVSIIGRLELGQGSSGGDIRAIAGGGFSAGYQMWKDATPTRAMNLGISVPGASASNDMVMSSFSGGTWTERFRVNGDGGISALGVFSVGSTGNMLVTNASSTFEYTAASDIRYTLLSNSLNTVNSRSVVGVNSGGASGSTNWRELQFQTFSPSYTNSAYGGSYVAGNYLVAGIDYNSTNLRRMHFSIGAAQTSITDTVEYVFNRFAASSTISAATRFAAISNRGVQLPSTTTSNRPLTKAGQYWIKSNTDSSMLEMKLPAGWEMISSRAYARQVATQYDTWLGTRLAAGNVTINALSNADFIINNLDTTKFGNVLIRGRSSSLLFINPNVGSSGTVSEGAGFHTNFNGTINGTDGGTGHIVVGGTVTANTTGTTFATSIGYSSNVSSAYGLGVGYNADVTADNGVAFGRNALANEVGEMSLGSSIYKKINLWADSTFVIAPLSSILQTDSRGWVKPLTVGSGLSYSGDSLSNSRESIYNLLPGGDVQIAAANNSLRLNSLDTMKMNHAIITTPGTTNLLLLNPNVGSTGYPAGTGPGYHTNINGTINGVNTGTGHIVIGGSTTANGYNFMTNLGYASLVGGNYAIGIGYDADATGSESSMALGYGSRADEDYEISLGSNNYGKLNLWAGRSGGYILAMNYGTGIKEAADLSKTQSNYISGFATDGTVLDLNIGTGLAISGGSLVATASAPNQILAESYNLITSTSSPQTFSSTISDNIVDQGGTQASFTFDFPASPIDGQILTVTWNNAISTLTLNGNGNTIVGTAVTTAVAGSQRKFKYCGTCSTPAWIKIY